jgi:transposase
MEITIHSEQIFISNKPVDFRKSIDGLCSLVIEDMQRKPGNGVYIFYNKNLNRIKVLGWHRNGFAVIYKRLESGRFFVRACKDNIKIDAEQLNWLLTGIDWRLMRPIECKNNTYF